MGGQGMKIPTLAAPNCYFIIHHDTLSIYGGEINDYD